MKYLAQYSINAFEISFARDVPYEKKDQLIFDAKSDEEAKDKARGFMYDPVGKGLFGPTVTLDRLFKIEEVSLEARVLPRE